MCLCVWVCMCLCVLTCYSVCLHVWASVWGSEFRVGWLPHLFPSLKFYKNFKILLSINDVYMCRPGGWLWAQVSAVLTAARGGHQITSSEIPGDCEPLKWGLETALEPSARAQTLLITQPSLQLLSFKYLNYIYLLNVCMLGNIMLMRRRRRRRKDFSVNLELTIMLDWPIGILEILLSLPSQCWHYQITCYDWRFFSFKGKHAMSSQLLTLAWQALTDWAISSASCDLYSVKICVCIPP